MKNESELLSLQEFAGVPNIQRLVIFDLDGVILRWPQYYLPNHAEQAAFVSSLASLHAEGTYFSVLTNRPPGHMQPIAYNLGVNTGVWVTESGGSFYLPGHHKSLVNPAWHEYARIHVPRIRDFLELQLGIPGRTIPCRSVEEPCFEPGMGQVKTCICPPIGTSARDYAEKVIVPVLKKTVLMHLFEINAGKAVDIDPVGLSKALGMQTLLTILGVDPHKTPTLFVADEQRDIEAGRVLLRRGGFVAAVGNAASQWRQTVKEAQGNGIVAPDDSSYFGSVTYIMDEFLKKGNI